MVRVVGGGAVNVAGVDRAGIGMAIGSLLHAKEVEDAQTVLKRKGMTLASRGCQFCRFLPI